jgi:hypothetical protein
VKTPGAFLARILVTTTLAALFLLVNAGFILSEKAIDQRIESLGIRTLFIRATPDKDLAMQPSLSNLFAPLSEYGTFIPLKVPYLRGETEGGRRLTLVIYGEEALPGLLELIPGLEANKNAQFVLVNGYPEGFPLRVDVEGFRFDALAMAPPASLRYISRNRPVLFVPEAGFSAAAGSNYQEAVFLTLSNVGDLHRLVEVIGLMLDSEQFERPELVSAVELLRELESMQGLRMKGQAMTGLMVALIIVLVYGSIAVFEYRQNVFNFALIKSFGISSVHIAWRYYLEAIVLMAIAYFFAVSIGRFVHLDLFVEMGFSRSVTSSIDPYTIDHTKNLIGILLASATAGCLPICFALRKPVGRILT